MAATEGLTLATTSVTVGNTGCLTVVGVDVLFGGVFVVIGIVSGLQANKDMVKMTIMIRLIIADRCLCIVLLLSSFYACFFRAGPASQTVVYKG